MGTLMTLTPVKQTAAPAIEVADLYERHSAGLRRWAIALVGNIESAEEIVQDAFVSLQQRGQTVDQPMAYLNQTVLNLARTTMRRQRRTPIAVPKECADDLAVDFDVDVWRAIQRLASDQRIVTVLRYRDDLPIADIANRIDRSEAAVKSLLHRALNSLRKELK
jgi:RNA polymerase sigma factor (sigma-70 family)